MVMRIGGLASGMDIDEIVQKMMSTYRAPVTKLNQKLQTLQWKQEQLREINRKILDFRNNTLFNFMMSSNLNKKTAVVTGGTSAVTATAGTNAISGTIQVDIVQKATSATHISDKIVHAGGGTLSGSTKLSEIHAEGYTPGTAPSDSDTFEFYINGEKIEGKYGWTINQLVEEINKKTSVNAVFVASEGRIAFTSDKTGKSNGGSQPEYINFTDVNDFLKNTLNIHSSNSRTAAQDAVVKINGITVTQSSNTFEVNGVSFTIHENSGSATIQVKMDTDAIVNSVKNFIEKYNELLSSIYGKLNEKRYKDYYPLTDEQRKEFVEKGYDLDEWNKRAQSGLLRNDSILSRLLMDMRMSVANALETTTGIDSLAAIGITQEKFAKGSEKNGHLIISDEQKLRQAIENDPEAFLNLFVQRGNGDNDLKDVGIAERLYNNMKTALDQLTAQIGSPNADIDVTSTLGRQITDLGLYIDRQNEKLSKIEANLYKKFSAMEKAISQYASQSAYLMQVFGGGA